MQELQGLQQILDQIEAELEGPLNVDRLASRAGYSRWHFQRLFAAATGTTPAGYIRARRLSEAARSLRSGQTGILPMALTYGFESQASFTRAFRQHFGLTPGAFRKSPCPLPLQEPLSLLPAGGNMSILSPEIIYEPARTVAGLITRFISAMSPQSNNLETIPALWERFLPHCQNLPLAEPGLSLGVITCAEASGESGELIYLAGVPVCADSPLPAELTVKQLPGGLYARFTHSGTLSEIGETMRRIYVEWLPDSGYLLDERPELEFYDQRFRPDLGQTLFDVLIPIREPAVSLAP